MLHRVVSGGAGCPIHTNRRRCVVPHSGLSYFTAQYRAAVPLLKCTQVQIGASDANHLRAPYCNSALRRLYPFTVDVYAYKWKLFSGYPCVY
uniref:Uncharacterized protein n=1 Tax=Romanomermis culicivorax TaxID=13658 RepID=A0A915K307_ROMCU